MARDRCSEHLDARSASSSASSADAGYAGERVATATHIPSRSSRNSAIRSASPSQTRRWVVERFFAWLGRSRHLAKDFEATIASATAFLYAASLLLLTRRLARS